MASIIITGTGTPLQVPTGTVVTIQATPSGAASYLWEFIDVPDGSLAAFDNAAAETTVFTVDISGSYLIRVTVGGTDIEQAIVASPVVTAQGSVRVPAAGETFEADGLKGWARAMQFIAGHAIDAYNLVTAGGTSTWKAPVQLSSVTGENVGPLTANSGQYPLSLDGVAVVAGQRVLLQHQTDPIENGIYVYADGGSEFTLTRASDFGAGAAAGGAAIQVLEGNLHAGKQYTQTTRTAIVGTDALVFQSIGRGAPVTEIKAIAQDPWLEGYNTEQCQLGDLVKNTISGEIYRLVDEAQIGASAGWEKTTLESEVAQAQADAVGSIDVHSDVDLTGVSEDDTLAYSTGVFTAVKNNLTAVAAPTATDDSAAGYRVGSMWHEVGVAIYRCVSASPGAAIWIDLTAGGVTVYATEALLLAASAPVGSLAYATDSNRFYALESILNGGTGWKHQPESVLARENKFLGASGSFPGGQLIASGPPTTFTYSEEGEQLVMSMPAAGGSAIAAFPHRRRITDYSVTRSRVRIALPRNLEGVLQLIFPISDSDPSGVSLINLGTRALTSVLNLIITADGAQAVQSSGTNVYVFNLPGGAPEQPGQPMVDPTGANDYHSPVDGDFVDVTQEIVAQGNNYIVTMFVGDNVFARGVFPRAALYSPSRRFIVSNPTGAFTIGETVTSNAASPVSGVVEELHTSLAVNTEFTAGVPPVATDVIFNKTTGLVVGTLTRVTNYGGPQQMLIFATTSNPVTSGDALGILKSQGTCALSATANPDTLTDAGATFITDGVLAGSEVTITGSGAGNDGTYTVGNVLSETVLEFTDGTIPADEGSVSYAVHTSNNNAVTDLEDIVQMLVSGIAEDTITNAGSIINLAETLTGGTSGQSGTVSFIDSSADVVDASMFVQIQSQAQVAPAAVTVDDISWVTSDESAQAVYSRGIIPVGPISPLITTAANTAGVEGQYLYDPLTQKNYVYQTDRYVEQVGATVTQNQVKVGGVGADYATVGLAVAAGKADILLDVTGVPGVFETADIDLNGLAADMPLRIEIIGGISGSWNLQTYKIINASGHAITIEGVAHNAVVRYNYPTAGVVIDTCRSLTLRSLYIWNESTVSDTPFANDPNGFLTGDREILLEDCHAFLAGNVVLETQTDGVCSLTASPDTFTSALATFITNGVTVGDVLELYTGANTGFYQVTNVVSETVIEVADGSFAGGDESGVSYNLHKHMDNMFLNSDFVTARNLSIQLGSHGNTNIFGPTETTLDIKGFKTTMGSQQFCTSGPISGVILDYSSFYVSGRFWLEPTGVFSLIHNDMGTGSIAGNGANLDLDWDVLSHLVTDKAVVRDVVQSGTKTASKRWIAHASVFQQSPLYMYGYESFTDCVFNDIEIPDTVKGVQIRGGQTSTLVVAGQLFSVIGLQLLSTVSTALWIKATASTGTVNDCLVGNGVPASGSGIQIDLGAVLCSVHNNVADVLLDNSAGGLGATTIVY